MKTPWWPILAALFLCAVIAGCARYPDIPQQEVIRQPPAARPAALSPSQLAPGKGPEASEDYRIGPEDVLTVKVWNHEDLSREVPVSQDGDFTYPLIGQIKAAGRTAADVEKEMVRRLADGYLVKPQVSVTVKEYRSQKVHVVGEVKNPGTMPLTSPTSLVEILSRAGGPGDKAGTEVLIIRPADPGRKGAPLALEEAKAGEVIPLDLRAIQQGDVSHNARLQHGDTVIVLKAKYFFVFGEVKRPGQFYFEQGITVLKAITIAGGLTDKASARRTTVVREKGGVRREIPANLGDFLEPNDIVMVPESFF